jgi:hypothetical protein
MPTPTDLVTDLPADFEVFGQAVDTSMADLQGGTTGQILSKASNTDMDFTWITNDVGDITAVTVSSPLTGGGTSGSVSVGILNGTTSNLGAVQLSDSTSSTSTTLAATANAVKAAYDKASTAATTSVAGIVQLSDSTSTTSSVLASTPTATKSAYDLAALAIPKSTVTTAGDIIFRNGSAPTRLGIGTAGQVLTVNSGATAPEWATAVSGGMTLLSTTTLSGASTTISSISQAYTNLFVQVYSMTNATADGTFTIEINSSTVAICAARIQAGTAGQIGFGKLESAGTLARASTQNAYNLLITNYANATNYFLPLSFTGTANLTSGAVSSTLISGSSLAGAVTSLKFSNTGGSFTAGTVLVYGVK